MATTYTWNVSTVDTYPTHTDESDNTNSDVIFNVHYQLTGDDETNSETIIGTINLDVSDTSSFIDFDTVTTADVEAWVISALGEDSVQSLKDSVQNSLNEKATPTVVTRTVQAPSED